MEGVHIEVKRVERGNVHNWMDQAVRDAGDQCPVVMHRKNRTEWLITVRLTDVRCFADRISAQAGQEAEGVG